MAELGYDRSGASAPAADVERNEYGAPAGGRRRPGARTRTEALRRTNSGAAAATPPATRLTYEQALQKVEWAYRATLHDDFAKAASELRAVDAWLKEIASGADLQDTFGGKSGAVEQATGFIGQVTTRLRTTLFVLGQDTNASRGQWKATLTTFKAAKPYLITLNGELPFEENQLLGDIERMTSDAYKVHAAIASLPAVLAIGAYAAPIVAQELALMGGEAVIGFVLANPVLATEIGVFAVGAAMSIAMSGGLDAYLDQMETDDGKRQALQDLMVILEMIVTHQPRAPRPRDGRARVRAKVEEVEEGRMQARIVSVEELAGEVPVVRGRREPTPREVEAIEWARKRAESTPDELRDPPGIEKDRREYVERQDEIDRVYAEIMRGDLDPPPGLTRERLRAAMEGDPGTGERIPLTFPDEDTYHEFQRELRAVFESEGITDAIVQQVGSATNGFRGNPKKPFAAWSLESDADFAVFSAQALAQAMDLGVPVNTKVTMDGRYTVLKNRATGGNGFANTTLGQKLDALASKWKGRLWASAVEDAMDFKLNLTTEPFSSAITVLDMGGGE